MDDFEHGPTLVGAVLVGVVGDYIHIVWQIPGGDRFRQPAPKLVYGIRDDTDHDAGAAIAGTLRRKGMALMTSSPWVSTLPVRSTGALR